MLMRFAVPMVLGLPAFCHWSQSGCSAFHPHHEERRTLGGSFFVFCRQHISHLVMLLWSIYWVAHNDDSFEWGLEQNMALEQVQSVVQSDTEFSDAAAGPVAQKTLTANSDTVCSLWQVPKGAWPLGFVLRSSSVTIFSFRKAALGPR